MHKKLLAEVKLNAYFMQDNAVINVSWALEHVSLIKHAWRTCSSSLPTYIQKRVSKEFPVKKPLKFMLTILFLGKQILSLFSKSWTKLVNPCFDEQKSKINAFFLRSS